MDTVNRIILSILIIFSMGIYVLTIDNEHLVSKIPIIYIVVFVTTILGLGIKKISMIDICRPSMLLIFYVSVFFIMGTSAYKYELILNVANQGQYYYLENLGLITFYFICSFCVLFSLQLFSKFNLKLINTNCSLHLYKKNRLAFAIFFSISVMFLASYIEIQLPGGKGSFSEVFFVFSAIHLGYTLKSINYRYRHVVSFIIVLIIASKFYSDRRLLAFYVFILFFIEMMYENKISFNFKRILSVICVILFFVTCVIGMSIVRGVGQHNTKNFFHSLLHVTDYLSNSEFKTMILHNLEGPGTTFQSYNAINYAIENNKYSYGSTFLKVLFLPIPRDILPEKPRSMVDEYNRALYSKFREKGGSYVPNLLAEFYWNFGFYGGLFSLWIFFFFMDFVYFLFVKRLFLRRDSYNVVFLSSLAFIIFFMRGSGLELYILFIGLFHIIYFIYIFMFNFKNYFIKSNAVRLTAPRNYNEQM